MGWATDSLGRAGYRVIASRRFPIRYKERFVNSQIDMALMRVRKVTDGTLAEALTSRGEALRERALALVASEDGIRHGFDYVIAAEPI
jgi:hypothetical protein